MFILASTIRTVGTILTMVVLADILFSYFASYDQPIRRFLDMIVEPMLDPIRRVVPPIGGLDFSPMVLIILLQLIEELLVRVIVLLA